MTGNSTVFFELDRHVAGMVCFGDGSVLEIEGHGTVVFITHELHGVEPAHGGRDVGERYVARERGS